MSVEGFCNKCGYVGPCKVIHAREAIFNLECQLGRPFVLLRPRMFQDGNQWCALYGDNLQDGVAGFGESPELASYAFDKAWNTKVGASA